MMRYCLFIVVFFAHFGVIAQPTSDEQLATHYYQSGDYEKAALYYEKLYQKNSSDLYYDYLLKSYLEIKAYDKAKKHVKSKIKSGIVSKYNIDQGIVFEKEENIKKAEETYQKIIKNLPTDASVILQISNAFLVYKKTDWALETLLKGRKLLQTDYPLNIEIGEIYEAAGRYEEMVHEYLDLLRINTAFIQSVQGSLNNSSSFKKGSKQYDVFKRELISYTQKYTDQPVFNDLLIWLYLSESNFSMAYIQAKAMDKRFKENGERVMQIAQQAYSNSEYNTAIEAYNYVISKGDENPFQSSAKSELLSVRRDKIIKTKNYTTTELNSLDSSYEKTIQELKNLPEYVDLVRDQCLIKAIYMNQLDAAIDKLTLVVEQKRGEPKKLAQCKLDLGDYLVLKDEVWDASLYYSQVEKDYKYDELGEQAKFKNAKISFYTGDFLWAKAQLDVLKGSTSKLIANDALWLSVIITDNTTIDTNEIPLKMYAKADLFSIQNKMPEAVQLLDSILILFPEHSLEDDIWFQKHLIFIKQQRFQDAIDVLLKITSKYPREILADDALYKVAEIYHYSLQNNEQAMTYYQKLLEEYSGSLYVVEARKRFRMLRGDNIN